MFNNKKIFILGMARSGYEAAKILAKNNSVLVTDMKMQDEDKVLELKDMDVNVVITECPTDLLDETFDFVVKNPGIKLDHPVVLKANELNIPVINEMEVAYNLLPKDLKIVGITGSNGKTTTTTLTYEFLNAYNLNVHLAGNIGKPLCSILNEIKPKDILVLEISSHQLTNFKNFKVDISILTNLSEVHLDHFGNYENYKKNKLNIFKGQTKSDIAILNKGDRDVYSLTKDLDVEKIYFSSKESDEKTDVCIKDEAIYYKDEFIIELSDIRLKGMHNYENVMCAIAVAKIFKVPNEVIREVLNNFAGVEHRLEFVRKVNQREFYNDSKSTNVKSTQVALSSFENPVILLLGGLDRGHSFADLKDYMGCVKHIICFGETKDRIEEFANTLNIPCEKVEDLELAVKAAYNLSDEGDTILLSPACASWDQYKSFEERGSDFKRIVEKLEG